MMYQIKPLSQLTCSFHVESEMVTETSGSEAQECNKSPSRQLKNEGEKFFCALCGFAQHYMPLCTAFGSGCTTPKDLAPPLSYTNPTPDCRFFPCPVPICLQILMHCRSGNSAVPVKCQLTTR